MGQREKYCNNESITLSVIYYITLLLTVQIGVSYAVDYCETPTKQQGDCKPIRKCALCAYVLYALIERRPISKNTVIFLKKSHCGFVGAHPKVCCPIESFSPPTNKPPIADGPTESTDATPVETNLLPDFDVCGPFTQINSFGGEKTDLDEFPWMALIEYERPDGSRSFHCGGVLINQRYVLTAAHCLKGKDLPTNWKLVSVRLGEYNTETEADCVNYGFGYYYCAPPPINIVVEEKIVHEKYDPNDNNQYHDIALLRLGREVTYSDYIKPICLPTSVEEMSQSFVGQKLFVAGWGKTKNRSESNIKLKVQVPVKNLSKCSSVYNVTNVRLGSGQLCAGGEKNRDSCRGDSGGPLMTIIQNKEPNWFAAGVVSFGPSPCGTENWPAVYTKVSKYVNWIVSKLRP